MTDTIKARLETCYFGVVHNIMRAMGLRNFTLSRDITPLLTERMLCGPARAIEGRPDDTADGQQALAVCRFCVISAAAADICLWAFSRGGYRGWSDCVEALAVIGEGHKHPFHFDLFDAAQLEACEAEDGFDDAEDGFDGGFSFSVLFTGLVGLQFRHHLLAPWRLDGGRRFIGFARRAEIISTRRAKTGHGDQRLDLASLQSLDDRFRPMAGIGQQRPRFAMSAAQLIDEGIEALTVVRGCEHIARQHQLTAVGIHDGLGVRSRPCNSNEAIMMMEGGYSNI